MTVKTLEPMDLDTMGAVQAEHERKGEGGRLPLDPEGAALAETKRFSLDMPEYVVKNDPLR